jgi:hypothetical protein
MHAIVSPLLLLATVRLAGDGRLSRSDIGWTLLAWISFAVPSVALAALAGPELPSLGGALIGLVVFAIVLRRKQNGTLPDMAALARDLAPYAAILALVLATRLIGPVQETLSALALSWSLEATASRAASRRSTTPERCCSRASPSARSPRGAAPPSPPPSPARLAASSPWRLRFWPCWRSAA